MILHPSIIALFLSSVLISMLLLYSSYYGVLIVRKWDIKSGSELQLYLERRTYLISTILTYVFGFQLISLFLYVYTADLLHPLFVGAMCASGTLSVNSFGYPTLILKVFNFLTAGLWLVLNYTDNRAFDYPLIKSKYKFLIVMAPLVVAETFFQTKFFMGLKPDIITSCCSTLFTSDSTTVASDLASVPSIPGKIAFYSIMVLTLASGVYAYLKGRGGYVFSSLCGISFVMSIVSLISFFSLYYYELPSLHCPFNILHKEYYYIGYPLYLCLFGGTVAGMGTGVLMPFRKVASLTEVIPGIQKKLITFSLMCFLIFTVMVTYKIVSTPFKLQGY
ncbi:MAG TPA: hypothetical protein VEJ88_06600 [Dissulfurispiraceae bacterium]|nr:hypothetical protein [Dissulfurispiraceae bacterium]